MIGLAAPPATLPWLLSGPAATSGPETLASHVGRLGPQPLGQAGVIGSLRSAGLRGRGGARFPAWIKWEAVARQRRRPVVLVNGAEGEPGSAKDRTLMQLRPHLVLDGAWLAAETLRATEVVVYVNRHFGDPTDAIAAAIEERRVVGDRTRYHLVPASGRYVAGEETAAVRAAGSEEVKPYLTPPRPFERGVAGRPTLVQNVETLALAALVGRFGADWFRSVGTGDAPGPVLMTIGGHLAHPGVYEIAQGSRLPDVLRLAGAEPDRLAGVLLGGYFGSWVPAERLDSLTLDDAALTANGLHLGCGVVLALGRGGCGVTETARILQYLAGESAGQCGPCIHGLAAMGAACAAVAAGRGAPDDILKLRRWAGQLGSGRGACRHPDGAARLLASALREFAWDFDQHLRHGACGTRL
ncbi:MAG: hypothetical protein M3024_14140 [Candidatus Dormibacteraeota bacterium]|nr:hypothetical protein [Candidatus Dormibacteraeota bacterium]